MFSSDPYSVYLVLLQYQVSARKTPDPLSDGACPVGCAPWIVLSQESRIIWRICEIQVFPINLLHGLYPAYHLIDTVLHLDSVNDASGIVVMDMT